MSLSEGIYNVFPKSWEEYVDRHGPRYEKVTGRDREDLYNNEYQRQRFERELERRGNQAIAARLTEGFGVQNTIAAAANELAGIASLVGVIDGPGGITMDDVYEALRTPYQYNKEAIEQSGIALTEEGDRVVQDFIEQNALTSVAGQAAVIVPELIIGFNQVPDLARQVSRLIKKRQTGQALTAAENAELLKGIKELDEFKLPRSNIGAISKTGDFTDVPDVRMAPDATTLIRGRNISTSEANKAAEMYTKGKTKTWSDLTKSQRDSILDKRNPRLNLDTGKVIPYVGRQVDEQPVYGGDRDIDKAFTLEADKAAAYHSAGTKKYSDYKPQKVVDGKQTVTGTDSQHYIRKNYMRDGKFRGENKMPPKAKQEELKDYAARMHRNYTERFGTEPTLSELHVWAFGGRPVRGYNHERIIRALKREGFAFNTNETLAARASRKLTTGTPPYEDAYDLVVRNLRKAGVKDPSKQIVRGHSLREIYFGYVPEEIRLGLVRPKQLLTAGQNIRHIHYENAVISAYMKKLDLKTLEDKIINGKKLFPEEKTKLRDIYFSVFGKEKKFPKSFLKAYQSAMKGINKELNNVDNLMKQDNVGSTFFDPYQGRVRQFGAAVSDPPRAADIIRAVKDTKKDKGLPELPLKKGGGVADEIQKRRDAGREYDNGRFVVSDLQDLDSVKALQQQIRQMYESEIVTGVRDATEKKFEEIQEDAKRNLRTERPVKFKASELPNVAKEFVFKPVGALMTAPAVGALNSIEATYNFFRQGEENDVDMKQKFPNTYKLFDYYTSGIGATPEDQTYIGFIDESIRAVQKGSQNLGYGILDLAYSIPDFAFETDLQERLQAEYDKHAFADPETFLGNAGAIMVEFGVPSTTMFKFLNFVRKGIKARTGVNLAATSTYGLKGAEKAKTAISNVAKRVGIVAPSAFAGEFVGGSRYNTLTRMDPEDPLFLDEALGYNYIDTTGLSGKERTIADLKNRIRFGTEGALVAGMFPLLGPALAKVTKNGVIKPSAYIAGKGLQLTNFLAIKPVSYLLARTPIVAEAGQLTAQGLGLGASFLGKDILARAALGAMGTPTAKQLPDFKDWRMFSVTSSDPLERNIKRFDNFLAYFRDTANQTADRFFITGQTSRKIKATSRKIEKQLDIIEKRAYDLARGFLKDYNTGTTSPAKQQYYLDQVLAYMRGQVKAADLPDMLKEPAEALNKTFMEIKRDFADVLPEKSGMREFLESNLRQYMRASFASFTNPLYKPDKQVFNKAVDFMVDRINRNESMVEAAVRQSNQPTDVAIRDFAKRSVESILERGKSEGKDPIDALNYIARTNLKLDDLAIQTGEELPKVIRELLGEEKSLRASVMTTASDLASQTANVQMYDRLADLGLKERWLYTSADEAVAAGIADPKKIGPRLPGLGKLNSPISNLYGGKEVVESIVNTAGPLDTLLKNGLYQNLIAYKAMVQTGKTVFSPATQTRNFGSAGFFPLQSGHIGGSASVTDAFKIILDDVFGAGKVADEQQLIDRITRKVELGVLDENVVVSELKDILQDVKRGNLKTLSKFSERVDNTKLSDVATRLYAGGDNVWKWYGHEFVMSQIKNGFKNVDDVVEQYKRTFGPTINPKNLQEGIEQYAATLIRETYPTYSKVPKLIQTIRRIPFIGNFVSFPAEILRTTFATTGYAMKHIASDNPTLRELGYRTLMGQFLTYGGIGAGTTYLGQAMTNVTTEQLNDIKQYFVPEFMRFSDLVPMTNIEDGVVKVFDNSRYFPYDLITSTVGNAINRASRPGEKLDPDQIETDMFKDIYNYTGPFADLAGGTLFGVSIGYEPALDFLRGGKTKTGSAIYSKSDTTLEKFDKMFAHTFETINPGFVRTLTNLYRGAAGLLTGTGQPIKMTDEVFKLFGGSTVTIDIPGSFRYQIGELKSSFKEPKVAEGFYRPDFRTGAQLVREYNEQNEEAFREQYEFYKVVRAALRNQFMDEDDVEELLEERVGKKTAKNIVEGIFTPLSVSEGALEGRFKNMERGSPNEFFDEDEFLPLDDLEDAKDNWEDLDFESYERELREPEQRQQTSQVTQPAPAAEQEPQTPELAETPAAIPGPPPVASVPNPATGLTPVESSLLSREEQLIRQRQRGLA